MSDFTFKATNGDDIPAGRYPARVTKVEIKQAKETEQEFRVWFFKAKIGGDTVEVTGATSLSNAVNSKAYGWITAILGRDLATDEVITLDDLTSRTVIAVVKKDAAGYAKVESLIPFVTAPAPEPEADAVPF